MPRNRGFTPENRNPVANSSAFSEFDLRFEGQTGHYRGKVRDVYRLENGLIVMVASDRISAFDVVLPKGIPHKGQVLNQTAAYFLEQTAPIVPNWYLASPHPVVSIGYAAEAFKVEMVVRGHLSGHAWRTYAAGGRTLCGVELPEGMRKNEAFPRPIITPTTKADQGMHDEDISKADVLGRGIVEPEDYALLEDYSLRLFARGQAMAEARGLILVDTKYEFGRLPGGRIVLIDEVHTPDSSRYFERSTFAESLERGEDPEQLSKEFVREWLMEHGFQGKPGQAVPAMESEWVETISRRYRSLYERITDLPFQPAAELDRAAEIQARVNEFVRLRGI
ncbi:phosphoribosylaminoimidazolesuccinocarboxamide synthase [bacterium]|nr:phosphoribosylaminoimidazolesuccinocarboxamide synthase [bacterium]